MTVGQLSLTPVARLDDPETSHRAARTMKPGNVELVAAIVEAVVENGPGTSWQIAVWVRETHGDRWLPESVRTACKRAGLVKLPGEGVSPSGNGCSLYALPGDVVPLRVKGNRL